jgi:hypothetical protein
VLPPCLCRLRTCEPTYFRLEPGQKAQVKLYGTAFGSPLDPQHEFAHFYQYEEIMEGWELESNPTSPADFHYAGASIPFDKDGVNPVITNPSVFSYT